MILLLGTLGFSSVAQADIKWFETINGYCPEVCQKTDHKFAVPSGVHPQTGKTFYICAVNYSLANTGWRAGYNIKWGAAKSLCYAQWHKMNSGKNSYKEHYFCMCADKEMPLITDDMVKR